MLPRVRRRILAVAPLALLAGPLSAAKAPDPLQQAAPTGAIDPGAKGVSGPGALRFRVLATSAVIPEEARRVLRLGPRRLRRRPPAGPGRDLLLAARRRDPAPERRLQAGRARAHPAGDEGHEPPQHEDLVRPGRNRVPELPRQRQGPRLHHLADGRARPHPGRPTGER